MDLRLLPPGFHFTPTAEELLFLYLYPRNNYGPKSVPGWGCIISDVDLYGEKEPWCLFPASQDQRLFYAFTDLKKVTKKDGKSKPKGKNNVRVAGSGFWWGRAVKPVKDSDGKLIGMDHYYTFETKKSKSKKNNTESGCFDEDSTKKEYGHWTMHEYSSVDENGDSLDQSMVVCVVGCDTQINVKHSVAGSPRKKRRFPASTDLGEISSKRMCTGSPSSVLVLTEPQEKEYFTGGDIEQWLQKDQQTTTNSALLLPECEEAMTTEEQDLTAEEIEQWLQEDQQTTTNSCKEAMTTEEQVLTAEKIEQWPQEDQPTTTNSCKEVVTTEEQVLTPELVEQWLQEYQETPTEPTCLSDGGSSSHILKGFAQ